MKMTDEQVRKEVDRIENMHASDWSKLVYRASEGRSAHQVAALIGRTTRWVNEMLDLYALEESGEGRLVAPKGIRLRRAMTSTIQKYAPKTPDKEYVDAYVEEGMQPDVAKRMAKVYEAGVVARGRGEIKDPDRFQKEAIKSSPASNWQIRLNTICSKVKTAAQSLSEAKQRDLERDITAQKVAIAHAHWMFQIERIRNVNPDVFEQALEESGNSIPV